MLVDAISRDRSIQTGVWLCLLPALCFGTLSVLAPLRLSDLGWGAAAVGATYLVSAGVEAAWAPVLGDSRINTAACALCSRLSPGRPSSPFCCHGRSAPGVLAAVIVLAGFAFGSFWTPAMSLVTDAAETRGLDYGYAFALVNLAWAPGQAGGAALGRSRRVGHERCGAVLRARCPVRGDLRGAIALQRDGGTCDADR